MSRNIYSSLFLVLCFPRYFLETNIQFHARNNRIVYISLKSLKQQFSKMADVGNIVVLGSIEVIQNRFIFKTKMGDISRVFRDI